MFRLITTGIMAAALLFAVIHANAAQVDEGPLNACLDKAEPYLREWQKKNQDAMQDYNNAVTAWQTGHSLIDKGYREASDTFAGFRKSIREADPYWLGYLRDYRNGKLSYANLKRHYDQILKAWIHPRDTSDPIEDQRSCRRWQSFDTGNANWPDKASGEATAFDWGRAPSPAQHSSLPIVSCYFQGRCDILNLRGMDGKDINSGMANSPVFAKEKATLLLNNTHGSFVWVQPADAEPTDNVVRVCIEFNLLDILDKNKDGKPTLEDVVKTSPNKSSDQYARTPAPFRFTPNEGDYVASALKTRGKDSNCARLVKNHFDTQAGSAAQTEARSLKGVENKSEGNAANTKDNLDPGPR